MRAPAGAPLRWERKRTEADATLKNIERREAFFGRSNEVS